MVVPSVACRQRASGPSCRGVHSELPGGKKSCTIPAGQNGIFGSTTAQIGPKSSDPETFFRHAPPPAVHALNFWGQKSEKTCTRRFTHSHPPRHNLRDLAFLAVAAGDDRLRHSGPMSLVRASACATNCKLNVSASFHVAGLDGVSLVGRRPSTMMAPNPPATRGQQ